MHYKQIEPLTIPMLPERLQLVDRLVAQVKAFAESSDNNDVRLVSEILSKRLVLRIPRGDGWTIYYYLPPDGPPVEVNNSIFIAPVKSIDLWQLRHDDVARRYETSGTNVAGYYSSTRSIYFSADAGFSIFWYGQMLLHESIHVLDHDASLARGAHGRHWFTEWHAYRTQYEVLCEQFGHRFTDLLDSQHASSSILAALDAKQRLRDWRPDEPLAPDDLRAVFGTPCTSQELDYWHSVVSRCLVQHALRCNNTGEQRRLAVV